MYYDLWSLIKLYSCNQKINLHKLLVYFLDLNMATQTNPVKKVPIHLQVIIPTILFLISAN